MTIGPILVTGGSGQVAQALGRLAPARDMEAVRPRPGQRSTSTIPTRC